MRQRLLFLMTMFCACFVLLQTACSSSSQANSGGGNPVGMSNCDFTKKGAQQSCSLGSRTSLLYLPPATCSGALPIVIYLHGAPGDIYEGNNNGWPATAAKDCFIEVNAKGSILQTGVQSWHIYDDSNNYS